MEAFKNFFFGRSLPEGAILLEDGKKICDVTCTRGSLVEVRGAQEREGGAGERREINWRVCVVLNDKATWGSTIKSMNMNQ